jgi:molecular chaperone GrpE
MRRRNTREDKQAEEPPEVRVTDRRRVYLDQDDFKGSEGEIEQPNLKPSYVEELEARTKTAERQVQEVQARFDQLRQQLQRETDETRQRLNRAADERASADKARFVGSLLPVMDDLQRAIQAANDGAPREAILEGIQGIATSFGNALASVGVEPIESVGEEFNPELHEAVDTVDSGPEMDGRVVEEFGRGFRIGDRLVRPARVKVGRATNQAKNATE